MDAKRRFLLDNDGGNIFSALSKNFERDIAEAIEECSDNVTTYLVCPGAGTFDFPTQVGIVNQKAPEMLKAFAEGKDPLGLLLDGLRKAGKETFITFRTNDVHNPTDENQWNTPKIRREHPDFIVDIEAAKAGKEDWMIYCLDYSRPEVRDYFLAIFRELVGRYELDGFLLDWMRFPRHLSGTPEKVWEKRTLITDFMSEAAELFRKNGVTPAARIPTSLVGCRTMGLDIAEWTRRGLVEFLVASPFLTTDFWMPLDEMRKEIADAPVPIYGAFDFNHAAQDHCPESLRATATSLYDCGFDGIYVFNFPCWAERVVARPYDWLEGLEDPASACGKPLLFSVSLDHHRIAGVDLPAQLPAKVRAGGGAELSLYLPRRALPTWRAYLLVRSGGDIRLHVNGVAAEELPARRHARLFVECIDYYVSQGLCPAREDNRVFRFDPSVLKAGENALTVENISGGDLEIKRVNLGLW